MLDDLVPYVKCGKSGYDPKLMGHVGVRASVEWKDVLSLIDNWYAEPPENRRNPQTFLPYLKLVARFAKMFPAHVRELQNSVKLYVGRDNKLVPFELWRQIAHAEYPATLVDDVVAAVARTGTRTLDEVIDALFACSPLELNGDNLVEALVGVGRFCEVSSADEVKAFFIKKLQDNKLNLCGKSIITPDSLPVLCDLPSIPIVGNGFVSVRIYPGDKKSFLKGVDALDWPYLSQLARLFEPPEVHKPIDADAANRVYEVFDELIREIESPRKKGSIEKLGLFTSPATVAKRNPIAPGIRVSFQSKETKFEFPLPYWFDGETLFVSDQENLNSILLEFVDITCETNFAQFSSYIWSPGP